MAEHGVLPRIRQLFDDMRQQYIVGMRAYTAQCKAQAGIIEEPRMAGKAPKPRSIPVLPGAIRKSSRRVIPIKRFINE